MGVTRLGHVIVVLKDEFSVCFSVCCFVENDKEKLIKPQPPHQSSCPHTTPELYRLLRVTDAVNIIRM